MKKFTAPLIIIGIMIFIGLICVVIFYRPRYESSHAMSIIEAKPHLKINLPDSANEIWILDQSVGPGHFLYMARFNIDSIEGIRWARSQGIDQEKKITSNPTKDRESPSWFDIESIQKGTQFSNSKVPIIEIWVDELRNIVFYCESD